MLWVRQLRQPNLGSGCDTGDEWFPDRDEEVEGAAEEAQGRQPSLLSLVGHGLGLGGLVGLGLGLGGLEPVLTELLQPATMPRIRATKHKQMNNLLFVCLFVFRSRKQNLSCFFIFFFVFASF